MPPITQAIILARGLGTRMRRGGEGSSLDAAQSAAADKGSKGMMPFGSAQGSVRSAQDAPSQRPFLDYVLSALADAGVSDVVLVVAPEHGEIRKYYTSTAVPKRVRVRFAVQQEPRGTADAISAAREAVGDAPFLCLNSDNYYPVEAIRALAAVGGSGLIAFESETLIRESGIERERVLKYALLDFDARGYLTALREKPSPDDPLAQRAERWVSMNIWAFTPKIFEACARVRPSPRGELEVQDAVRIAVRELGEPFKVIPIRAGILDLSSRADVAFVAERLSKLSARP